MSDYRRFISYMYLYEHHAKSMNAGFVKVESRNGWCRLNLCLRNVYSGNGKCSVYVFVREKQELRGIYLGEIQIKNHGCDWEFRTEVRNIAGSGYVLEQLSGMIVQGENDRCYGTRWDQGELELERFVTEWEIETECEKPSETELEPVYVRPPETEKEQECVEQTEAEKEKECVEQAETEKELVCVKQSEEDTKMPEGHNLRYEHFEKILEKCPGMYPFEDDVIETCVRIEPQDIGMMPLDCWSYGNNSFLLHGYYSYRHLILARMKQEGEASDVYILGVPGTQHSRDAFMANMFGFRAFKPIREDRQSAGDFGYWYAIL